MHQKNESLIVPGFTANGIRAGIKEEERKDLSLILSDRPAAAAGVFTTNAFKAAPVILDMERLEAGEAQAILANSGNANAATGTQGLRDARAMAKAAARALKIPEKQVLVSSTGIIGQRLPMVKIKSAMPELVKGLRPSGFADAEEGIMTTDKFPKIEYRRTVIAGKEISLCGLAKGAGMIEPGMATMLSFILTDAAVDRRTLRRCLVQGVEESFNAISVDGCMSTNDTVIVLAGGQAGNRPLTERSRDRTLFREVLTDVMRSLSLSIVRDGEGATKVIGIRVEGARTRNEAKKVAFSIARSNLVKAAFFGQDPNWGRIIAAIGASGVPLDTDAVSLYFDHHLLFKQGMGVHKRDEKKLDFLMKKPCVQVLVKLGMGRAFFSAYASDLTHDYVSINAHYRT
jgi:glutamate N-acetyltransferase/amino-acid N-acetyltransferase